MSSNTTVQLCEQTSSLPNITTKFRLDQLFSQSTEQLPVSETTLKKSGIPRVSSNIVEDNDGSNYYSSSSLYNLLYNPNQKSVVILLRGLRGSRKSILASEIKTKIESVNGKCWIFRLQKKAYSSTGSPPDYLQLFAAKRHKSQLKVIVILGLNNLASPITQTLKIGKVTFEDWTVIEYFPNLINEHLETYLTWTLKNVLLYEKENEPNKFVDNQTNDTEMKQQLGVKKNTLRNIIDTHNTEAKLLFGKFIHGLEDYTNFNEVIVFLTKESEPYENWLSLKGSQLTDILKNVL